MIGSTISRPSTTTRSIRSVSTTSPETARLRTSNSFRCTLPRSSSKKPRSSRSPRSVNDAPLTNTASGVKYEQSSSGSSRLTASNNPRTTSSGSRTPAARTLQPDRQALEGAQRP